MVPPHMKFYKWILEKHGWNKRILSVILCPLFRVNYSKLLNKLIPSCHRLPDSCLGDYLYLSSLFWKTTKNRRFRTRYRLRRLSQHEVAPLLDFFFFSFKGKHTNFHFLKGFFFFHQDLCYLGQRPRTLQAAGLQAISHFLVTLNDRFSIGWKTPLAMR